MRTEELLEIFETLPIKAKIMVMEHNDYNILEDIALDIDFCKSPIEIILLVAINIYKKEKENYIYVEPQIEVECNNKKYIVDFLIEYDEMINNNLKKDFKLAIECDGYEFHQKNKRQVEYDNKREYDLKMHGYEILRFSGSEIYNEPKECVERIFNYLKEKAYDR